MKLVDTILPTTTVGSYPRPDWYTYQLSGRDVRVAFKNAKHAEAYTDATAAAIRDQEEVAARIRKVLDVVPAERVYLTTDCGLRNLPRIVCQMKLRALAEGAALVRRELTGVPA